MFNHLSYSSNEQTVDFRRFIAENKQNIELITSRLMLAMGFKLSLSGATYLREAIVFCYNLLPQSPKISFSRQVYPHIAQKYNSNATNVDRSMRTALNRCYESGNILIINNICGCDIVSINYPPTVVEFVIQLSSWIKSLEMECASDSR